MLVEGEIEPAPYFKNNYDGLYLYCAQSASTSASARSWCGCVT